MFALSLYRFLFVLLAICLSLHRERGKIAKTLKSVYMCGVTNYNKKKSADIVIKFIVNMTFYDEFFFLASARSTFEIQFRCHQARSY